MFLAQEVLKNYHKDDGRASCTMKVDLMKAYDSVNWDFIIQCLVCLGFPSKLVNWIKECVTSPGFLLP